MYVTGLAKLYIARDRFEETELLREALETQKRLLGENHPFTAVTVARLIQVCVAQGRRQSIDRVEALTG